MFKPTDCYVNQIEEKIIVSKKFAKAAGTLNTPEYTHLQQARRDNPGFTVELREIKKKENKNSHRNLSFERMETYLSTRYGAESQEMKEFLKVKELAKVQSGPYAFVKTWFLKKCPDYQTYTDEAEEQPKLTVVK